VKDLEIIDPATGERRIVSVAEQLRLMEKGIYIDPSLRTPASRPVVENRKKTRTDARSSKKK